MPVRPSPRLSLEHLERRENPATLYGLTVDSRIVQFDSVSPTNVESNVAIQNLSPGERVVGMDYRPRTGGLYALAVSGSGTGTSARLLLVNPLTGVANAVGSGFTLAAGDATGQFGFDFNPTVDRIRVINRAGVNLRLNPNNGALAGTDANIVLNGPVDAAAYDRNFDGKLGATGTTLYTINPLTGNLHTQGTVNQVVSPNTGTQFVVGPLGTAIDPTGGVGFDVAANGAALGGPAFAIFDGTAGASVNTGLYTINLTTGAATLVGAVGDGTGNFTGLAVAPETRFAVGSGAGQEARVEVYDSFGGNLLRVINPYGGFGGGVTVAVADVNRDSVPDVITGASTGGGPHVKVFDGVTGAELFSFFAYDAAFRGGVNVAAGDINGDGFADILTGAGPGGGPHVKAFSGANLGELASYFAFDAAFRGGVSVAAGDFNNDGTDEMVTAAGPGGGPHVRVFARDLISGITSQYAGSGALGSFFTYGVGFTGGVWVAVGDMNGDGVADIVTGADTGGGPHVHTLNGRDGGDLGSFFAFDQDFTGGIRVGVGDVDRDGRMEALVAPASNRAPTLRAFDTNTGTRLRSFDVLDGASGVFVGGGA